MDTLSYIFFVKKVSRISFLFFFSPFFRMSMFAVDSSFLIRSKYFKQVNFAPKKSYFNTKHVEKTNLGQNPESLILNDNHFTLRYINAYSVLADINFASLTLITVLPRAN